MESSIFFIVLLSYVSIYANAFGSENLTFFGEYVVFRPKTQFIKFDLLKEMDIVLLDRRTNKVNVKLRPTDYLYRIHLSVDDSVATVPKVNCTIQRKGGSKMVDGQYQFWNETEKNNMAISWGSEQRIIEVLTNFEGNHNDIFSWKDRSKNLTDVKYVGLAVASTSPGTLNVTDHRHLSWKVREAEPADNNIGNAYNMCLMKLLSGDPRNKSSLPTTFYQISITREGDNNFLMSLQKRNDEVLRATSSRMDCEAWAISWDAEDKVICFGLRNDTAPIFLWQDTDADDYNYTNFKYISVFYPTQKKTTITQIKMDKFLTIPELFPRYFMNELTARTENPTTATASVQPTTATIWPWQDRAEIDGSFMVTDPVEKYAYNLPV